MLFRLNRFAKIDLLKAIATALLVLFLIPLVTWGFTGFVQRSADAKAWVALEQDTLRNLQLSDSQRQERLMFYRQMTPSKVCGRSEPGLALYRASTCGPLSDLWQFHVARQLSAWMLLASVLTVAMALGLLALARVRPPLQRRAFVLGGWLHGLVGVAQLLVQAGMLAWLCYWLPVYFAEIYLFKWLVPVGLCVAAVGVIYTVFLMWRFVAWPYRLAGERLDEQQSPLLWANVRATAARLETAPPDQIVASIDTNFFVAQAPLRLGREALSGRTLYVSLALLRLLSRREADALLAHELAHFGHDAGCAQAPHTHLGVDLHRYDQYSQQMRNLRLATGVFYLMRAWRVLFQAVTQRDKLARELSADQAAAQLVSPGSLVRALIKMVAYAHYRKQTRSALFARNHQTDGKLDFEYAVASGFVAHTQSAHFMKVMRSAQIPHPFDAHPSLRQRMKDLGVKMPSARYAAVAATKPTDSWLMDIPEAVHIEQRLWAAYELKMAGAADAAPLATDNAVVKLARPPLVQFPKGSTGGTSGLHRAA
jgi:Zn-dependent protease with chaperone function